MKRRGAIVGGLTLALAGVAVGFLAGRARADGVPSAQPLVYGGVLEESGALVTGTRDFTVRLWDAQAGGSLACPETNASGVSVRSGAWRAALDSGCVAAVQRAPDLWVEVVVGGVSLGRSKVGAVPFAVEASRASGASGALETRLATVESAARPRLFVAGPVFDGTLPMASGVVAMSTVTATPTVTGRYRVSFRARAISLGPTDPGCVAIYCNGSIVGRARSLRGYVGVEVSEVAQLTAAVPVSCAVGSASETGCSNVMSPYLYAGQVSIEEL